jgi:hypothetical protein
MEHGHFMSQTKKDILLILCKREKCCLLAFRPNVTKYLLSSSEFSSPYSHLLSCVDLGANLKFSFSVWSLSQSPIYLKISSEMFSNFCILIIWFVSSSHLDSFLWTYVDIINLLFRNP